MSHTFGDGGVVLDTPDDIQHARRIVLAGALWLEIQGLQRRGRSAYAIIKDEFHMKGSRLNVYRHFVQKFDLLSMEKPKP